MFTKRIKQFIKNCIQITIIIEMLLLVMTIIALSFDAVFSSGMGEAILGFLIIAGIFIPAFAAISIMMVIAYHLTET